MPTYLIESNNPHYLHRLSVEHLQKAKNKLQEGISKGIVKGVWAKLGGGSIWIVEASSNAALERRLRKYNINNVKVTPLLEGNGVLDAYAAAKQEAAANKAASASE